MTEQNSPDDRLPTDEEIKQNYFDMLAKEPVNHLRASERPLQQVEVRDSALIEQLGKMLVAFKETLTPEQTKLKDFCDNVQERLLWANTRFQIYESALLHLGVGRLNNVDLAKKLYDRADLLIHLYNQPVEVLSNADAIDALKKSNDPRLTHGVFVPLSLQSGPVHYPTVIKEFLDRVDEFSAKYSELNKPRSVEEPKMLEIKSSYPGDGRARLVFQEDQRTRRWIRREWIEWFINTSGAISPPSVTDAINIAAARLTKQLFPEGVPADVEIKIGDRFGSSEGIEIEIRKIVVNSTWY